MTYGDGVGNINIRALLDFHKRSKKLCTMTSVKIPGRFGSLEFDKKTYKKIYRKTFRRRAGGLMVDFLFLTKKLLI